MNSGDESAVNIRTIIEHVMFGLRDESLIHEFQYGMGFTDGIKQYGIDSCKRLEPRLGFECGAEFRDIDGSRKVQSWSEGVMFAPTARGCELFLRAHGIEFHSINQITDMDLELSFEDAQKIGIGLVEASKASDASWKWRDAAFTGASVTSDIDD
jgi:hypothetical protein